MRVLVCGSRTWTDTLAVWTSLDGVLWRGDVDDEPTVLITGGARGADRIAYEWGMCRLPMEDNLEFPADWNLYGKAAGPIRNEQMLLEGKPDLVVAFSEVDGEGRLSRGTQNMVDQAKARGVPVWVVSHG